MWAAIADPERRRRWWPQLDLEARAGGQLLERWHDERGAQQWTRGEVLEAEPGRRLRCSWRDDGWPAATELDVVLSSAGPDATEIVLRHAGWEGLPDGAALRAAHARGWSAHLADWKAHAEGGGSG